MIYYALVQYQRKNVIASKMSYSQREDLNVVSERAILVAVTLMGETIPLDDRFDELAALTESAGGEVVGHMTQKRRLPYGKTYIGSGKISQLKDLAESTKATVIIFDHELTPSQIRNIEEVTERKIIDRSELILDIFSSRASTAEAKLQVEIAQLQYTYPRLRAMWDHLGQVTGGSPVGIGTRGPGEQQIEIDRRLVQRKKAKLKKELAVIQNRAVREVEKRNDDHFTVGLVGYTNAGKSTLFNTLTSGGAWAHDQLFATLSTRIERWELGRGTRCMLSDTVGFIRRLPHHLVASFQSTLEETVHCKLLVIVLDASDPMAMLQLDTVEETLESIGATKQERILVLNKIDMVTDDSQRLVWVSRCPDALQISSITEEGVNLLIEEVRTHVIGQLKTVTLVLPSIASKAVDFIEKRTEIHSRDWNDNQTIYSIDIGLHQLEKIMSLCKEVEIDGKPAKEMVTRYWPNKIGDESNCDVPPHRI